MEPFAELGDHICRRFWQRGRVFNVEFIIPSTELDAPERNLVVIPVLTGAPFSYDQI